MPTDGIKKIAAFSLKMRCKIDRNVSEDKGVYFELLIYEETTRLVYCVNYYF